MAKFRDSLGDWRQRWGLLGAMFFSLCAGGESLAQRVSNNDTQFLPPDEVRRALRKSYVPPPKAPATPAPKIQPDPTAGAERRVELNALFEAAEAWRLQGVGEKAVPFYEKAAAKGHAPSLLRLGEMYSDDAAGLVPDPEKAARYFAAAARTGDRTALHRLGVMHRGGLDGKPDTAKANSYFRRAMGTSSRGDTGAAIASAAALLEAGIRLERGDLVRMVKMIVDGSDGAAADRCAILLAAADLPPPANSEKQPPERALPEPAELRQRAMMELEAATVAGGADLPRLQYQLAVLLVDAAPAGEGTDERAARLFQSAAAAGYPPAVFRLQRPSAREIVDATVVTEEKEDVSVPDSTAMSPMALIEAAAEAGDAEAQVEMGQLLLLGAGREKSTARAFEWFRRSSRGGATEGHYQLGRAYSQGIGTKVNAYNAAEAFRRAAERGHPDGMYEFGRALGAGRGIKKDGNASAQWLQKASAAGSGAAALALGREALRSKADGTRDVTGATRFFLQGARTGDHEARFEFLKLVFAGDSGPVAGLGGATEQEIFTWSTTLANDPAGPVSRRKLATYYAGLCHARGIGTFKNLARAAELLSDLTGVTPEKSPVPSP